MPRTHVPVLAGELIEALDPRPGEIAIDCTLGAAGHARLVADRLGPAGTLIAIDRDPLAEKAFAELAAEVACDTRFIRADFEHGLRQLAEEGVRADMAVPRPRHVVDAGRHARARLLVRLRRPARHADGPRAGADRRRAGQHLDRRRLARVLRSTARSATRDRIAGKIVRRRPLETTLQLVDAITAAIPAPARFAGGHPAKRSFQAIRIAVNDELGPARRGAAAGLDVLRVGGRLAAISFHSLEDRRVKRFLTDAGARVHLPARPAGRGCGRTPEVEPVFRRAVAPSPGEVADNPRSTSARLRAARKLREGF